MGSSVLKVITVTGILTGVGYGTYRAVFKPLRLVNLAASAVPISSQNESRILHIFQNNPFPYSNHDETIYNQLQNGLLVLEQFSEPTLKTIGLQVQAQKNVIALNNRIFHAGFHSSITTHDQHDYAIALLVFAEWQHGPIGLNESNESLAQNVFVQVRTANTTNSKDSLFIQYLNHGQSF